MQKKTTRNGQLDAAKIIAALFVVVLHSCDFFGKGTVLPYGYLAVEFFFVVTGLFFASSLYGRQDEVSNLGQATMLFIVRKVRVFIKPFIIGFVLNFVFKLILTYKSFNIENFCGAIMDAFLFRETGLPIYDVMGVDWYLSSMIIALFVLYPLFRVNMDFFSYVIAPIFGISILSYLFSKYKSFCGGVGHSIGFCTCNTLRALAEICIGICAFRLSRYLQSLAAKRMVTILVSTFDLIIGASIVFLICTMQTKRLEPFVLFLIFLFVSLSASERSIITRFMRGRMRILGDLSMVLFLTHSVVRRGIRLAAAHFPGVKQLFYSGSDSWQNIVMPLSVYIALSLCFAYLVMILCKSKQDNLVQEGVSS